jgi:predicted Ser/Thr protein kinase
MAVSAGILPRRYRDPRLVARGGMGEVYCATDSSLGRTVAIKLLAERYAADGDVRKRFTREALAAARLSGEPHTITIYDVGESRGRPFIVMEYLAGGSLEDALEREGAQAPHRALSWLEQAALALDRAHAQGIVHRDVKPANLLLDRSGDVHVADFGIATAAGMDSLTRTGTVLGTVGYLAPEQAEGKPVTAASDRYGLGVVGFELLTGSRPFQNESITAEATAHVHAPVPSASARNPAVPVQADGVFGRALAKDPGERYSSCEELAAALRAAYDEAAGSTRIVTAPRRARRRSRPPLLPFLALLAVGLLAGGLAAALLTDGGGGRKAAEVRTVTRQGSTQRVTVTSPPPRTASPSGAAGAALAAAGYQQMKAGDYRRALPLLEQAAQKLHGSNSIGEAYNDYNLAFTLAKTSGCSGRVLQLLDRSQAIQGHRTEIDGLRRSCGG